MDPFPGPAEARVPGDFLRGETFLHLSDLLQPFKTVSVTGDPSVEIAGLTHDSRRVKPGDLFVCVKGTKYDGHDFLADAFAAGAAGAVVERVPPGHEGRLLVTVDSVDAILPELAARFHGYPAERLTLIGVVGTNGKTTSTYLIRSILETAGYSVGLIGTIQNLVRNRALPAANTTPGSIELQALLAEMAAEGCQYVVMEVSSHAIALGRTRGCRYSAGLFTNITEDHLDFHKSFAEYFRVKQSFFADLGPDAWAVINGDDPKAAAMLEATRARTLTYGLNPQAMVRAERVRVAVDGASYQIVTPVGQWPMRLQLTGHFNVYNSLGALSMGLALGIDPPTIKRGLGMVSGVPGRFQTVSAGQRFGVVVDYAHTADGLENLLKTARQLTPGTLILVFGCGGDRDRGRRSGMGRVAARYADAIFVTSDNPRSEDPAAIIKEIEDSLRGAGKTPGEYRLIVDRTQAIRAAIAAAQPNDLVVIAGKGHETYQDFGDHRIHFDDREVAAAALEDRKHGVLADGG